MLFFNRASRETVRKYLLPFKENLSSPIAAAPDTDFTNGVNLAPLKTIFKEQRLLLFLDKI